METSTLRDLYLAELNDLYSAEQHLAKALPDMAKTATDPDLERAIEARLARTEEHLDRLRYIFSSLGVRPSGEKSRGIEWLIVTGRELNEHGAGDAAQDATIVSKAQHVERYEIAGYGTVRAYALMLGETDHAERLAETLNEERRADELLTRLAERFDDGP